MANEKQNFPLKNFCDSISNGMMLPLPLNVDSSNPPPTARKYCKPGSVSQKVKQFEVLTQTQQSDLPHTQFQAQRQIPEANTALTEDVLIHVFSFLNSQDIDMASRVCR
jgi:hypothetical protein